LRVRQLGAILEGVDAVLEIIDKILIKLSVVQDMLDLVCQYHYSRVVGKNIFVGSHLTLARIKSFIQVHKDCIIIHVNDSSLIFWDDFGLGGAHSSTLVLPETWSKEGLAGDESASTREGSVAEGAMSDSRHTVSRVGTNKVKSTVLEATVDSKAGLFLGGATFRDSIATR
jgi:hypothetical protein